MARMMPRSLQAAVRRLDFAPPSSSQVLGRSGTGREDDWQAEAWRMYREVGELSAVCSWMGSSASQVTLFAADPDPETGAANAPTDYSPAAALVRDMAGGPTGQSEMLRHAATLLTVCGELYVVLTVDDQGEEEWTLVPPDRVSRDAQGGWTVNIDGQDRALDEDEESLFRVWNRDPHHPEDATSSVRAALPVLREIRAMDRVIEAAARSRVAGAGVLIVPSEATIPAGRAPVGGDGPGIAPADPYQAAATSSQSFSRALSGVMKRALDDPGSPEAVTPIVVQAPAEAAKGFVHLTMESEITEQAVATRERAIRRLALSLDIPPEILTGLGDSTHWNAALVDEASLRQHIAPMLATICDALTTAVLQPLMADDPAARDIIVGFDMSALSQKTDRSEAAISAYDRGAISQEALRRELGFDPDDAPQAANDQERLRALAEKMVSQAPSLFPYLAETLGFPATTAQQAQNGVQTAAPAVSAPGGAVALPGDPDAGDGGGDNA